MFIFLIVQLLILGSLYFISQSLYEYKYNNSYSEWSYDDMMGFAQIVAFLLTLLNLACILYTPFLIAWQGMSVGKAMSASFRGCLKNFWAFFINGIIITIPLLIFGYLFVKVMEFIVIYGYKEYGVNLSTDALYVPFVGFLRAIFSYFTFFLIIPIQLFLSANFYYSYKTIFHEDNLKGIKPTLDAQTGWEEV